MLGGRGWGWDWTDNIVCKEEGVAYSKCILLTVSRARVKGKLEIQPWDRHRTAVSRMESNSANHANVTTSQNVLWRYLLYIFLNCNDLMVHTAFINSLSTKVPSFRTPCSVIRVNLLRLGTGQTLTGLHWRRSFAFVFCTNCTAWRGDVSPTFCLWG